LAGCRAPALLALFTSGDGLLPALLAFLTSGDGLLPALLTSGDGLLHISLLCHKHLPIFSKNLSAAKDLTIFFPYF